MCELVINGKESRLVKKTYSDGRIAIKIEESYDDGLRKMMELKYILTVFIPNTQLKENEILVKTWGENKKVVKDLRESEYFQFNGKKVVNDSGFVAEVWELNPILLEKLKED